MSEKNDEGAITYGTLLKRQKKLNIDDDYVSTFTYRHNQILDSTSKKALADIELCRNYSNSKLVVIDIYEKVNLNISSTSERYKNLIFT
ncbi:hypothetical protein A3Q56_06699 [Intoshia linei]|uniref:Uncharacterized protein n=1 Tax=Intoshia linei TaxID=1819745 RepID=A0A177AUD4_9BILA|nr:hypothetical protein A3Q56_06699 [Intoshia linei]